MIRRPIVTKRTTPCRTAIGLLEVVVSALLIGVLLVTALETLGGVYRTHRLNRIRSTGPMLAEALLTEVMSQPILDPETSNANISLEAGESSATRADFDDVDDYHGWDCTGPQDKEGNLLADYSGWRRQVDVVKWDPTADAQTSVTDYGLRRITITVTSPEAEQTVRIGYRGQQGMLEQAPYLDQTAVTWLGASLKIGATGTRQQITTSLPNHCRDAN